MKIKEIDRAMVAPQPIYGDTLHIFYFIQYLIITEIPLLHLGGFFPALFFGVSVLKGLGRSLSADPGMENLANII